MVPLADGFEEIEAATVVDVLRRAGLVVVTVGLDDGTVTGSHGIRVIPDMSLDHVDAGEAAAVVLPGGMPGAAALRDDERVRGLVRAVHDQGGIAAAICAGPIVLEAAGLLEGRRGTAYPDYTDELSCTVVDDHAVVVDGRLVTSRGPGTALAFALCLVGLMAGKAKETELAEALLVEGVR